MDVDTPKNDLRSKVDRLYERTSTFELELEEAIAKFHVKGVGSTIRQR